MTPQPLADILKSFPPLPPLDPGHPTEWLRMVAFIAWCREVPNRQWADIVIYFIPNDTSTKGILSLIPTPLVDWEKFEPAATRMLCRSFSVLFFNSFFNTTQATVCADVGNATFFTVINGVWAIPQIALRTIASVRTAFVSRTFPLSWRVVRSTWQGAGDVQVDQEAMVLRSSDGVHLLLGPVTTTEYPSTTDLFAEGFTIVARPGSGPPLVEETCSQKRYLAFPIVDSSKVSSKL
ncbi:uncharacterized protein EV420DRAFT_108704 [Desarmillaria tabescens]|uniref:Uncharacterized protein n=1 Tax=Armillaria tabescens TaxID=1929756 RepID=A0AA39TUA4_ARMTA|nr:uncharacterized protein EV420DRAFT_108704 [Desarmillaria tabescens]KAK0470352.1 hypothetical protein EV420DRAFT_108704 [Desarmillaria tabescens]